MLKKRFFPLLLAVALLLCACGAQPEEEEPAPPEPVSLSLWAYPVGQWPEGSVPRAFLREFNAGHDDADISFQTLGEDGSVVLSAALASGQAPDLLLGSIAQLQRAARSGAHFADLTSLCDGTVYRSVREACTDNDGVVRICPLAMDVTAMAINYEMFRDAGALQYIDEENHSWTTEGFLSAVNALESAQLCPSAAAVYCGGQSGDQGTRALVVNLYGGRFTDERNSRYTLNEENNLAALTALQECSGIVFDANITGPDENVLFTRQQLAMTFCWDSRQEAPEDFTAFPMAYPADTGRARLPGEVWGFAVLDHGDEARLTAALAFLESIMGDSSAYRRAADACGHYPVRPLGDSQGDVWSGFTGRMGLCDTYMPGWATARSEWWQLLQRIGSGGDVALETDTFCANANGAAAAEK